MNKILAFQNRQHTQKDKYVEKVKDNHICICNFYNAIYIFGYFDCYLKNSLFQTNEFVYLSKYKF